MSKLRFRISMSLDGFVRARSRASRTRSGIGGDAPARVGVRARGVAAAARTRGRRGEREHRGRRGVARQHRRHDHGPQHVRRPSGPVGSGEALERLVGSQSAVSSPGVRADAPRARAARARGRHDLHVRHRRHRGGARAGAAGGAGAGRGARRVARASPQRTCAPAWWTRWRSASRRCSSAAASGCSTASAPSRHWSSRRPCARRW